MHSVLANLFTTHDQPPGAQQLPKDTVYTDLYSKLLTTPTYNL